MLYCEETCLFPHVAAFGGQAKSDRSVSLYCNAYCDSRGPLCGSVSTHKCIDDDCRWTIDTPPPQLAPSRQTERRIPVLVYRRQTRYTTRINIRTEVSTVPLSSKRQSQGYDFFSLKVGWILENPVCFFCIVGGRIEIQAIGYLWN